MEQVTEKTTKTGGVLGDMFRVGAHFAYSKARRHPTVSRYIFGAKNNVEIFDLEKTEELLLRAKEYVAKLALDRKQVLFVGGKNEAKDIVRQAALSLDMPFVAGRWIGGTLTNFSEIKKRIGRLEKLTEEKEKGELSKYTKREQLLLSREMDGLADVFGGLVTMKELPAALFVIDTKREHIAVKEAKKMNIPVIGLMNSDCDFTSAEYPILANDASIHSIAFFVNEIATTYASHKATLKQAVPAEDEGVGEK